VVRPADAGLVSGTGNLDALFDLRDSGGFDRDRLRDRLAGLAARGVFIGGSSWKYEGWLDQIYTRALYQVRGKFSKKRFEDTCLSEYATVFPTVCGDFAFYQFPSDQLWSKLFRQTPGAFRWGLKAPEQITTPRWPVHPRYGALAGLENPTFLDAGLFSRAFLMPLEPLRVHVGVIIFEFNSLNARPNAREDTRDFVRQLDAFLAALPASWRYAVEVRNPELLTAPYFDRLRAHNVPHVYNAWTRMPVIRDQISIAGSRTSDLIVARALLRRGRPYEDAVKKFAPYESVQEVNEPVRQGLRELVDMAIVDGTPAFIFVNNRLEGNSPGTIVAITD
jgi:uncharacterized protein YecE (DUF72 family)